MTIADLIPKFLAKLQQEEYYGDVVLKFQKGQIHTVRSDQSLKLEDVQAFIDP